ncbi:MAG: hypothetical protein IKU26_00060 [Clostridia bacterium]|nr:hypothetical protein [Clostridia bacterium]
MFKNCQWIWGTAQAKSDEYMDFKLSFTGKKGATYRLNVSCDTDYALYKNGALIEFGQFPDFPDYKVYDSLDISAHVEDGENDFVLTVWYQGIDTQTYIKKPAGVIFLLTEDGKELLVSNTNTLSRKTPGYVPYRCISVSSQLGLSFKYDANDVAEDFAHGSYLVEGHTKDLVVRPIKKLVLADRFHATISHSGGFMYRTGNDEIASMQMQKAALVTRLAHATFDGTTSFTLNALPGEDGVYAILDMGRETAGFLDLDITVEDACDVLVGWGEHLLDGRVRAAIRTGSCIYDFCADYRAKAGRNVFLYPMRRLGSRYLQIFIPGKTATIHYAGIRETYYPVDVKPFDCGNLLRNRLYDVAVNTLRQCMHEHYEDCPWREQALYTMDSRNQMLFTYHAFGDTEFARSCLNLVSHGMREDRLLGLCYPSGLDIQPIPSFSLIYFVQMREYMDYSGDKDFLKEKYPFLQKLLSVFMERRREEDGLIGTFCTFPKFWNFYEWTDGLVGTHQSDVPTYEAPLNAFFSLALQNLAVIADALGEKADAAEYRKIAEEINVSIAKAFYNPEKKLFISFLDRRFDEFSVLTNSLCVVCGAAKDVDKSVILKIMEANGPADTGLTVLPSTTSMNLFRFDGMLAVDREHYKKVVLDEIDKMFFAMIQENATSLWETANGAAEVDDSGSLCHGWSAIPLLYYNTLLD